MGQIVLFIDVKFLKSTPHIFSELKIKLDSDIILTEFTLAWQKFGFIKRVDKGEITTVKDLESWRFER